MSIINRAAIEDAIERLIACLDAVDAPATDMEPGADTEDSDPAEQDDFGQDEEDGCSVEDGALRLLPEPFSDTRSFLAGRRQQLGNESVGDLTAWRGAFS